MDKIVVENLYKIFGTQPKKAMALLKEGHDKDSILEKIGMTVGVDRDFAREVAACWDLAALDSTIRLSQRRRTLVGDAMARGDRDHWDYEPQPDYSRIYVRTASGSELADRQIRVPAKDYELPGTSEGGG